MDVKERVYLCQVLGSTQQSQQPPPSSLLHMHPHFTTHQSGTIQPRDYKVEPAIVVESQFNSGLEIEFWPWTAFPLRFRLNYPLHFDGLVISSFKINQTNRSGR